MNFKKKKEHISGFQNKDQGHGKIEIIKHHHPNESETVIDKQKCLKRVTFPTQDH